MQTNEVAQPPMFMDKMTHEKESKINYIEANTLEDAANKAVKALGK